MSPSSSRRRGTPIESPVVIAILIGQPRAVQKVLEADGHVEWSNDLKQLRLALHTTNRPTAYSRRGR